MLKWGYGDGFYGPNNFIELWRVFYERTCTAFSIPDGYGNNFSDDPFGDSQCPFGELCRIKPWRPDFFAMLATVVVFLWG